jgi:hypothetical protein
MRAATREEIEEEKRKIRIRETAEEETESEVRETCKNCRAWVSGSYCSIGKSPNKGTGHCRFFAF